jgi:hypothetical protein
MADVKWTFFADTAAAERTIQQLEQKFAKLENAQTQMARKSKEGSSGVVAALKNQVSGIASLAMGYLSAGNAVSMMHGEAQKLLKAIDDIGVKSDVAVRKWRILANQTEMEGEASKGRIHGIGQKLAFSNDQAMAAARELQSAGFSSEQASGPALESLLKSLAANQNFDKDTDAGPLAKAAASYLQSQGQGLTGQNLEKIGMMADKLGDVSTFSISDVEEIAKHGAGMAGKLTQEEQFAATTHLITEGRPGSEAANALEKVTLSLTGKGDKKKTQEALKELGLTGADVDMHGETFVQSLQRLKGGLEGVAPERQDTILAKLFGVEHFSPAKSLITKAGTVEGLTKGLDDRAAFDADVAIGTGGRAAAERRAQAMEEDALEARAGKYTDETVRKIRRSEELKAGYSGMRSSLNDMQYNALRSAGASQEFALGTVTGGGVKSERVIELLEQSAKSAAEQVELLKKGRPALNRNAQGEAAR